MNTNLPFTEKHYLGRNSYGLSRRLVMILFCFIAHFYSEENHQSTGLFLLVGWVTIAISVVLLFIPLYTITLEKGEIQLKTMRNKMVRIPLTMIRQMESIKYSRYHFNNPVFNVRDNGELKFYAEGSTALLLQLEGGNTYRIGVKDPERLLGAIRKMKEKN
ncbi:MAG: hypothetical protein IPJ86_02695 [Bacteroidetes bacterium]|nr:hypothetical protein [Bacteroidota bacterium]